MFTIEKIANVPNPAIPQWRVSDPARCVTLSVRILKSHNRAWQLYAERWDHGRWTRIARVVPGAARSQALAYCLSGAFIERMYQNTGAQGAA